MLVFFNEVEKIEKKKRILFIKSSFGASPAAALGMSS